jgi:hypothetical protein
MQVFGIVQTGLVSGNHGIGGGIWQVESASRETDVFEMGVTEQNVRFP